MDLQALGYTDELESFRKENDLMSYDMGRVTTEHRDRYRVLISSGEWDCELLGNLRFAIESRTELPVVGDWVAVMSYDTNKGLIHAVLPRYSSIQRKAVGKASDIQLIASNIDFALIVTSADQNFNLNRLERYIVICQSANVTPIVILNKIDLVSDEEHQQLVEEIKQRIDHINVLGVTSQIQGGLDYLTATIKPGKTYCLLGSSGVGKSTIANHLMDTTPMETGVISESVGKGKHTTTHRELMMLPSGAVIIDNPGMREVGIANSEGGLEATFELIASLSGNCHYSDCTHTSESGCAVLSALDEGILEYETYQNYLKLQREQERFEISTAEKRKKDKSFGKLIKSHQQFKKRNH